MHTDPCEPLTNYRAIKQTLAWQQQQQQIDIDHQEQQEIKSSS
jgi:hypothetical protein